MAWIVYGMLVSLDGYIDIAGAEGQPVLPVPQEALHRYFNEMMKRTPLVLYGRRMYETMRVWETWGDGHDVPEVEGDFARAWRETPKIVFSTTLEEVGPNARLVRGDLEETVRSLRAETEGEIEVSGAGLAASLSRLGLIDEYRLFLHPRVLGGGKPFFQAGLPLHLTLIGMERLPQDVVLLRYAPADRA